MNDRRPSVVITPAGSKFLFVAIDAQNNPDFAFADVRQKNNKRLAISQ